MNIPGLSRLPQRLLMALFLATCTLHIAQAQYTAQVRSQLDDAMLLAQLSGQERTHSYEYGSLNDDGIDSYTVTLREDRSYRIFGACDADCSDLDLWIYDEYDNLIDHDTASDDTPILEVTPRWTGSFRIRVRMYSCRREPCYFGLGIFGQ